ncbi:hypothetical protein SETIT_1G370300v2 [Setaria italica]|uniref:C2H2-type domain-containing protein n=2 Tax=Setaria TaxID=4554 RepID=K3YZ55_SETIT|nr:zinc finger protein 7 [Setaria italica]XP_034577772.1 zinc finger protein 7-like [Setaria viridis]RCV08979.1 hypothetical protein SETIT_1G370300v2 [Setaria italica]TKW42324.1 hypothetical protein SEVIR_1G376900v2 [Setaria viridis]
MDLSQETNKDEGARTSSPSGEADDDKEELMQKQQRAGSGDEDDEGTRQPYKCTFCRRGFPTAQALGGHMNVHRRHRGRPAAPAAAAQGSSSSCYEQQPYVYSTTRTMPVLAAFGQTHPAASGASMAAGGGLLHAAELQRPYELRLFGRDCAAGGRGKEGGAGDVHRDRCYARDGDGGDHGGGEELDLELRLGGAAGS